MRIAPLILAAYAIGAGAAPGAPFADPTRPPNFASMNQDAATEPAGPRLESVLIAPDRRLAVISGQQYRMGDKYGEGRIVRITESEVAIRNGEAVEVLKLFPGIEKRPRPRRIKRQP